MTPPDDTTNDKQINPAINSMLLMAREFLSHRHSLFRSLNLEPIVLERGVAKFALDMPASFADRDGVVHGGLATIALDSIFGLTVFTALNELKPIATINLRTDFVAAAPVDARAICEARCEAMRDDVAYVRGKLTLAKDNDLIALGAGAFMVGTKGPIKGSRL